MNLDDRKILITGADGFIGSHLTETLLRQGHDVRAFVYYNSFNSWGWLDRLPAELTRDLDVFAGDIRDPHGVASAVDGCDVVLHLAALVAIPFSYHSPATYVETNVMGTLNILQAARRFGVQKIVHTSTSEVYGSARRVPMNEDHRLLGQSPYAASKIGADQLALSFYHSFDIPVAIIRPFNTYGPRQSARAVIPTIITQILGGARTLKLGALHPTRDLSHVADTVSGFIAMACSDAAVGEVINVGSGLETSIGDLAASIADIMEADVAIEAEAARLRPEKSEVARLLADITKAGNLLEHTPRYAGSDGLRRGLSETIAWFRDPANLRGYKGLLYNL
jgi:NAD dependent epimerase/dehydratase